ncbi:ATP-binding protein [Sphingomonas sp. ac-8]|uniref:ATP-binding protein n=1 Tax=Sphingomonas sp. ac-8 TaxID=3242977 RepID=UPI003A80FABE
MTRLARFVRPSFGLLGRIVAILLLTTVLEFGVSTLLYERASQFSVRDDEARRLAEHLVIARRLVAESPPERREAMADELTTDRYEMEWSPELPPPPPLSPSLDGMRKQVLDWEPVLRNSDLRLRLTSPGRSSVVTGGLQLPDGSWLHFRTLESLRTLNLAPERVLLALIPAIALIVIGGLLVRRTLSPMRQLATAADRVGRSGPEGAPITVSEVGPGEVRRVVAAFNRMQDRIHRLIDERTRALVAVGHDLRTPLARLRLRTERVADDELRETLDADLTEMEAMIASLLAFLGGEGEAEQPVLVDLAVLAATVADDAADLGGNVTYAGPDHLDFRLRPPGIKRALVNLVENALHHADTVCVRLAAQSDAVVLSVEDDGPGIPEESLPLVLEPFVRLDTARRRDTIGFGLGLSIVVRAVEAEGGRFRLYNRGTGGLCAEIRLPVPAAG